MQAPKNRFRHHSAIFRDAMPQRLKLCLWHTGIWRSRSEAGVWTSPIVMFRPWFKRLSNVRLVERNHEIQALPTCCPNQPLAKRVRLRRFVRGLQDRQPQCFQRHVQFVGIDVVAIMNYESVSFIARNTLSKLLQRPIGRRVARDIEMKESSRADFYDEEDVDQSERCRHNNEEIAGDDSFGVIAHKRHPALLRIGWPLGRFGHVTPNRTRRDPDADLQQQFIGNTFFAPGRVTRCHLADQLPQLRGHARSAAWLRFPFPK